MALATAPFPETSELITGSFEFFNKMRTEVILVFGAIFLFRLAHSWITFGGIGGYKELLKDTILMYCLLYFFKDIVHLLMDIPDLTENIFGVDSGEVSKKVASQNGFKSIFEFGDFFEDLKDKIIIVVYWVAYFIYNLLLSVLIVLAPFVIVFSTMFRFYGGLKLFFALMTAMALWPIMWEVFDHFLNLLKLDGSSIGASISHMGVGVAKIAAPLYIAHKARQSDISQMAGRFKEKSLEKLESAGRSVGIHAPFDGAKGIKQKVKDSAVVFGQKPAMLAKQAGFGAASFAAGQVSKGAGKLSSSLHGVSPIASRAVKKVDYVAGKLQEKGRQVSYRAKSDRKDLTPEKARNLRSGVHGDSKIEPPTTSHGYNVKPQESKSFSPGAQTNTSPIRREHFNKPAGGTPSNLSGHSRSNKANQSIPKMMAAPSRSKNHLSLNSKSYNGRGSNHQSVTTAIAPPLRNKNHLSLNLNTRKDKGANL